MNQEQLKQLAREAVEAREAANMLRVTWQNLFYSGGGTPEQCSKAWAVSTAAEQRHIAALGAFFAAANWNYGVAMPLLEAAGRAYQQESEQADEAMLNWDEHPVGGTV